MKTRAKVRHWWTIERTAFYAIITSNICVSSRSTRETLYCLGAMPISYRKKETWNAEEDGWTSKVIIKISSPASVLTKGCNKIPFTLNNKMRMYE